MAGETAANGNSNGRGIMLALMAIMVFGGQDVAGKILVQDYAPAQIVMIRYWSFAAFALFLVMRQGKLRHAFRARRPLVHVLRGALLIADVLLFALAVQTLPLGELHAVLLLFPILVTVFSIPLLGETIGPFRWGAVFAGFVGSLIILRPGFGEFDIGLVYGLAAAVVFALYNVLTRLTARDDSTATAMLYAGVVGLVVSGAIGIFYWVPLTLEAWGLIAITWVSTALGHFLMMRSLHFAPASLLQPFNFLMLPWAILMSLIFFGVGIDPISLVGATIIIAAGLTVTWRERVKARAVTPAMFAASAGEATTRQQVSAAEMPRDKTPAP